MSVTLLIVVITLCVAVGFFMGFLVGRGVKAEKEKLDDPNPRCGNAAVHNYWTRTKPRPWPCPLCVALEERP